MIKQRWENVSYWRTWTKGPWKFFALFLQLFRHSEISQNLKVAPPQKSPIKEDIQG